MINPFSAISITSTGITVTTTPDYLLDGLTAGYVILTLVLAIVAVVSIIISSRLSRDALAASDRQSKDAIEALQKQIDTSEKQTKETIEAVNRQIEASERQTQEIMYNQFKPVIVPLNHPTSVSNNDIDFTMELENKGAGVALNTWGLFIIKSFPVVYHFSKKYFLVPDRKESIVFNDGRDGIKFPTGEFHGYVTFPGGNDTGITSSSSLLITYNDVFGNKYLVVFYYSEELGWEQVDLKRVERRLDELIETKTHGRIT